MLDGILPFRDAGFALHWLRPRSKAPLADGWSTAPIADAADLRATWRDGQNVGVRLGEPSPVAGGYLHALDIDIRDPAQADDAWDAVKSALGDIDPLSLPSVVSGSGGESRHLYFVTEQPFYSRKIAVSDGKTRDRQGKWHYDWEVELYGTGKQVVFPPSIHPGTLKPYRWERAFDLDLLALGIAPSIPAARLEEIVGANSETYEYESIPPLEFKAGQLEKELDALPDHHLDDYEDWIILGQALHHQFGGGRRGYDLWVEHSKRSTKFDEKEMPGKWRSFGRNRRRPVTMASVRQWYLDTRAAIFSEAFDELPDEDEEKGIITGDTPDLDDMLGLGGGGGSEVDPLDAPVSAQESDDEDEDDVDPLDAPINLEWFNLLDYNTETGAIRPHLHNVKLLVEHDARIVGVPSFNRFTSDIVQRQPIGLKTASRATAAKPVSQLRPDLWQVEDPINGQLWDDTRDNDIRRVFEAPKTQGGYGIKITDRDLTAAVDIVARQNGFHPIHEYLEKHTWDGTPRIDSLFIDYLGAPDNVYTRQIARLTLIAAVTRVYEPGHKFDFAPIIEGFQGRRKSTFISVLGQDWFAELDGDFHDTKQMVEQMQGGWIMEIPELSGFNRADVRAIKAFISRQEDRTRLAYARRAGEFPRQCIFIGSTNDREYLKDDTGGRRFWPVFCSVPEIDIDRLAGNVDQIWAEALAAYRQMRAEQPYGTLPLYLTDPAAQAIAKRMQETRRVESVDDGVRGIVSAWLDRPIQSGGFDDNDGKLRDRVCLMEIHVECLGGRQDNYPNTQQLMLSRVMAGLPEWENTGEREICGRFGRQRVYRRVKNPTA